MFIVVDGNHTLHRILRVPYLTSGDKGVGGKFGGVAGFLKSLQWLLRNALSVYRCIVVWDTGLSKRRLSIYPDYKGKRDKKPLDEDSELYFKNFVLQRSYLEKILPLLRVNVVTLPEAEGDDLIYECVKIGLSSGFGKCVLVSEDKDFMQLIAPDVSLYRPVKRSYVNESNFFEVAGVGQESFLLYKALCGDSSDKIQGVKGVGEKTAKIALNGSNATSLTELCSWSSNQKSSRINKIPESVDIIERNISLMKLGLEVFDEDTIYSIRDSLRIEPCSGFEDAFGFLVDMEFSSITRQYDSWVAPFVRIGAQNKSSIGGD
ncbi:MAG: hypothetical protein ACO3L1_00070 [Flavobacteriaceae bacterium]